MQHLVCRLVRVTMLTVLLCETYSTLHKSVFVFTAHTVYYYSIILCNTVCPLHTVSFVYLYVVFTVSPVQPLM